MSLIKLGEAITISTSDIQAEEAILADPEFLNRFKKVASELKSIAPKAKDFLYFSAIMMHAAEASLLDVDGKFKKNADGKELTATWEKKGDSWVWKCSDPSIRPYKNSNNDIFPEEELIKAYKKWVGRPLCLDHKSSSVDMIRGLIIDTYYDWPHKRVVALCALDKINYPDLARKVSTGYATSVSMGTAVGRAICFDCGNVARIESDFCNHMKNKSCYGEINVDLNPIELSIVVNGADPKAKIRHIVAAADNIANYIEMKQKQVSKIAEELEPYDESEHIEAAKDIEDGLEGVADKINELKEEVDALRRGEEAEQNNEHQNASNGQMAHDHNTVDNTKVATMISGIYQNLENLKQDLHKLYQKKGEDKNMTSKKTAYFQGGGGVNEPAPKQVKYPKEEADKIRDTQDKQVAYIQDIGSVTGLFPGDEQKKRELNRLAAEQEERALRRQAALRKAQEQIVTHKEAYFQGGGGVNEPTPGKPKYPKEEADKIRDTQDKQMVGAPPFPGVGKPDGLYGDDLKKKEMLSRAKLTAKFVKAANPNGSDNPSESRWQVFADNKLILTATVSDISGGKVEALYDTIATPEFGKKILAKIRTEGFDKAASVFKSSQAMEPTGATGPAPAPTAMPSETGMPATMPSDDKEVVDNGGTGDPKEELPKLLDEAENTLADIRSGVNALTNNSGNNLADFDQLSEGGDATKSTVASAVTMHKKLSKALLIGMKQAMTELEGNITELRLAKNIYDNEGRVKSSDLKTLPNIVKEACEDARHTIAECYQLEDAFVKYARGTEILVKHAFKEKEFMKMADGLPGDPLDPTLPITPSKPMQPTKPLPVKPAPAKPAPVKPAPVKPSTQKLPNQMTMEELMAQRGATPVRDHMLQSGTAGTHGAPAYSKQMPVPPSGTVNIAPGVPQTGKADDMNYDDDDMDYLEDENDVVKVDKDGNMSSDSPEEAGKAMKAMKSASFDLKTKEGRAMLRAKLAEKGLAFSDILGQAHSGGVTPQLDVKPTGDLAKVETLEETHKVMMDVATAPVKVRKMAEDIQKLVIAGKIDPDKDFQSLISQGLDSDAVKYWKSYYGQAKDGGSQFAAELVQEYKAQKMANEKEAYKVKIARAYELAYDMARKGMIGEDHHALNQQVNELMSFNDEGFESMKRYVERNAFSKQAHALPQVGMLGSENNVMVVPAPEASNQNLVFEYERLFSKSKY